MSWLNWIKDILGIPWSEYMSDLSDGSSDCESKYSEVEEDETMSTVPELFSLNLDLTTDAARRIASLPKAEDVIFVDNVRDIERMLDEDEIVSLVFLLYEHVHIALQKLFIAFKSGGNQLIYDWAVQQEARQDIWQRKLVEALCIIKNYQVLKHYGYNKTDSIFHYLPHLPNNTLHISRIRKALYLICEKLTPEKTTELIEHVRNYFHDRQMSFIGNDQPYLELYLLQWEAAKYISQTDLGNLKSVLKLMNEEQLCNILDEVSPQIEISPKAQDAVQNDRASRNVKPSTSYDNMEIASNISNNHRYEIDPEKPGVVLIINQEAFYREVDAKYKHLLPPEPNGKLETRSGTEMDKKHLERIFIKFGFKVIVWDNLRHLEMIEEIEKVVNGITNESSLFVCILSHGDKGVVYGANSCKVKVSHIQSLMSKNNLLGKPKILILQSCQGPQCQKLNETSSDEEDEELSLTTDGPSGNRRDLPRTTDLLVFWATVPGYASIRNKKTGSWFIQALCRKMEEYRDRYHFADICTRTSHDVTNKVWDIEEDKKAMSPMMVSTLRFDFYLPPLRN